MFELVEGRAELGFGGSGSKYMGVEVWNIGREVVRSLGGSW